MEGEQHQIFNMFSLLLMHLVFSVCIKIKILQQFACRVIFAKRNFREKNPQRISGFLIVALWWSGYHYCTTSVNKARTNVLCRFKSYSWRVRDLQWWVSLTMVLAGQWSTIPQNYSSPSSSSSSSSSWTSLGWPYFGLFGLKLLFSLRKQCSSMFLSKLLQDSLEWTAGGYARLSPWYTRFT